MSLTHPAPTVALSNDVRCTEHGRGYLLTLLPHEHPHTYNSELAAPAPVPITGIVRRAGELHDRECRNDFLSTPGCGCRAQDNKVRPITTDAKLAWRMVDLNALAEAAGPLMPLAGFDASPPPTVAGVRRPDGLFAGVGDLGRRQRYGARPGAGARVRSPGAPTCSARRRCGRRP